MSKLTLALQCGGSDSYSGITANPALGIAADMLVEYGGSTILSETPEIYGAEHLLTKRSIDPATGEKLVNLVKWWKIIPFEIREQWTIIRVLEIRKVD